jgi:hypothetical protein
MVCRFIIAAAAITAAAAAAQAYLLAEAEQPLCITQLHCLCLQVLWAQPAAASVNTVKLGQTWSNLING